MDKEYIEREDLIKQFTCAGGRFVYGDMVSGIISRIKQSPAADVAEVRHGEWKILDSDLGWVEGKCSACGYTDCFDENGFYNYCPECGAKMDGGGNA